jgi:hypothetical protein
MRQGLGEEPPPAKHSVCGRKTSPLELHTCEGCSRVILASRAAAHALQCARRPLDPDPPAEPSSCGRAASSGGHALSEMSGDTGSEEYASASRKRAVRAALKRSMRGKSPATARKKPRLKPPEKSKLSLASALPLAASALSGGPLPPWPVTAAAAGPILPGKQVHGCPLDGAGFLSLRQTPVLPPLASHLVLSLVSIPTAILTARWCLQVLLDGGSAVALTTAHALPQALSPRSLPMSLPLSDSPTPRRQRSSLAR